MADLGLVQRGQLLHQIAIVGQSPGEPSKLCPSYPTRSIVLQLEV